MTNKEIATTILQQMGGNKFIAMTGSKNFVILNNGIRMSLSKNPSNANRLEVILNGDDTYTMRFYRYTTPRFNSKTLTFSKEKVTEIKRYEGIYFDQLQDLFTETTYLYTRLF